ncbi:hypothetical protein O181_080468 [Austropuccinia psidii MF-1]|uniref:Uncharacterized protein n=1 Tax=Austropuccinia psidii MF-1 TaxID=1389203 RepID=A0A9Q3FIQ0_9BASI|nr:hypothetical protein [Austropuccinia psidii MF-1]
MSQLPSWTSSIDQWVLLRDQLSQNSEPSLSTSSRLSTISLIVLCSISLMIYLFLSIIYHFSRCHPNQSFIYNHSPFRFIHLHLKPNHHSIIIQPNLSIILPFILSLHALLNIISISSLLNDIHQLKFKPQTYLIQQFNYSLLILAGILINWCLVYGLPPFNNLINQNNFNLIKSNHLNQSQSHHQSHQLTLFTLIKKKIVKSFTQNLNLISLILLFLIDILTPLPFVIIISLKINLINQLDQSLLDTINQVIQSANPTANLKILAISIINSIDKATDELYFYIKILAAIHLFLTLLILIISTLACCTNVIRRFFFKSLNRSPSKQSISLDPQDLDDQTKTKLSPSSTQNLEIFVPPSPPPTVLDDRKAHDWNSNLEPNHDPRQKTLTHQWFTNNQIKSSGKYSSNSIVIKLYLAAIWITGTSFTIMNFCILTNFFKYPNDISVGGLMILTLRWSSWAWNGSLSPTLAIMGCIMMMKRLKRPKSLTVVPMINQNRII